MGSQYDCGGVRDPLLEPAYRLYPIHAGHLKIDDEYVRAERRSPIKGFNPVGRGFDQIPLAAEYRGKYRPDSLLVVDNKYFRCRGSRHYDI